MMRGCSTSSKHPAPFDSVTSVTSVLKISSFRCSYCHDQARDSHQPFLRQGLFDRQLSQMYRGVIKFM